MATGSDFEARAAAGDAEAQFAAGIDLIAQADTFEKFERAVTLVEQSAAQGHPEATCMLATMAAVGAGRPRDWDRALDLLEAAAGLGSEHAQGQLRLLRRMSEPDGVEARECGDWHEARRGIDMKRLLRAPAPVAVSDRPRLRHFQGFARPEECTWVIDQLRPKLHPAVVWDQYSGETVVDPFRSNSAAELPLRDMDVVIALVRARIAEATRLPEFLYELPQLMHYEVGQEFRPHHDFIDPSKPGLAADLARRGQRMGTFLIYLNDDFEGGETAFPAAGISFRGRTGDALFFANILRDGSPDPLTLHTGRPPTSGEKWILSQWIRERPPAEAG